MPITVPWFNDSIDSTLPPYIKPPLYAVDEYQTHDLVWGTGIHNRIIRALGRLNQKNFILNDAFTSQIGEFLPLILIERFTPVRFSWCEEYSTKLFSFLKQISYTEYLTLPPFTNCNYVPGSLDSPFGEQFNTQNSFNTFVSNNGFSINPSIVIELPRALNQWVTITYLELNFVDKEISDIENSILAYKLQQNSLYNISSYSKLFCKRQFKYILDDELHEVKLDTKYMLVNSLVFDSSDASITHYLNNQVNAVYGYKYLFKDFDLTYYNILLGIEQQFKKWNQVLSQLNYTIKASINFSLSLGDNRFTHQYDAGTNHCTFVDKPDWYYGAAVVYANNDYWRNEINRSDIGKRIDLIISGNQIQYSIEKFQGLTDVIDNEFSVLVPLKGGFREYTFSETGGCCKISLPAHPGSGDFFYLSYPNETSVPGYEGQLNEYWIYLFPDYNRTYRLSSPDPNLVKDVHNYGSFLAVPFVYTTTVFDPVIQLEDGFWYQLSTVTLHTGIITIRVLIDNIRPSRGTLQFVYKTSSVSATELSTANFYYQSSSEDYNSFGSPGGSETGYYTLPEYLMYYGLSGAYYPEETFEANLLSTPSFTNIISYTFFPEAPEVPEPHDYYYLVNTIDSYLYNQDYVGEFAVINMPDSIRIKEIHAALDAAKFAYDDSASTRVANIGYYVERIARVLGISVSPDGSIRAIRQKGRIKAGDPIPAGWNFGQWGLNEGEEYQKGTGGTPAVGQRDGIAYESRSNQFSIDEFSGSPNTIDKGDYTLCENIPQLLDEILDDLDKALGWQEAGAWAIPSADRSGKICTYEGLHALMSEIAYMLSSISRNVSQTEVAGLITQATVYEILRAFGQPLTYKTFPVHIGGEKAANIPYAGLAADAPSQVQQTMWILQNLAPLLAKLLKTQDEQEE